MSRFIGISLLPAKKDFRSRRLPALREQAGGLDLPTDELTFIVAKVERAAEPRPVIGVHRIEQTYRFRRALRDEGLVPPWYEFR